MFDFIDSLRQKPDKVKKRTAFLFALSFAGIIFVVWLSVIYPGFKDRQLIEEKVANLEPKPASGIKAIFSAGLSQMKDQLANLKSAMSSFSSTPTYYSATTSESVSVESTTTSSISE